MRAASKWVAWAGGGQTWPVAFAAVPGRTYLLIHSVSLSKHCPSSDQSRNESVPRLWLATVDRPLSDEGSLVDRNEPGQVQGVLFGRLEDEARSILPTT